MNQTEKVRNILHEIETGRIVTYDEIIDRLSFKTSRQNISSIMHRLECEGMVTKISNAKYKKEPTLKISLFVYGSLKRGFANHNILEGAKYIGKARTIRKFAMFEADSGYFPRLIKSNSSKTRHIHGEIYEIHSLSLLEKIDQFEGYNYQRENIKVETSHGRQIAKVYISNNVHIPKNTTFCNKWTNKKVVFHKDEMINHVKSFLKHKRKDNSFA